MAGGSARRLKRNRTTAGAIRTAIVVLLTLAAGLIETAHAQTQYETVTINLSSHVGQSVSELEGIRFQNKSGQARRVKVVRTPESPYQLPPGIGTPYPSPTVGLCSEEDDCKSNIEMVFPAGARNLRFTIVGGAYSPGSNYCSNGHSHVVVEGDYPAVSIQPVYIYGTWSLPISADLGSSDIKYVLVTISESMKLCGLGVSEFGFRRGMAIGNISFERPTPGPAIELVDPACSTTIDCGGTFVSAAGNLVDNPALLVSAPVRRDAAAADGATKILLRARSDVGMRFSLKAVAGQETGRFTTRDGLALADGSIVQPESVNGNKWVLAVWEVPANLLPSLTSVIATIGAITEDGRISEAPIRLVRPLPLLVHGVWSNGGAWKGLADYLADAGYPACGDCVINYGADPAGSAPSFDPFGPPSKAIDDLRTKTEWALNKLHREGVAAAQVDVVAHSMGGLVARARAAQVSTFRTRANYYKGEFHKIITVGTPHLGTPAADWIIANRCTTATVCLANAVGTLPQICTDTPIRLEQAFAAFGKPIGPAIFGFQTSGAAIDNLGRTNIPSHAIVGIAPAVSAIEDALNFLARLFGSPVTIDGMLGVPQGSGNHDTIVPQASQRGGLTGEAISDNSRFAGIVHAISSPSETDSPAVFAEVLRLLQAPTTSTAFDTFPGRKGISTVPPSSQVCPASVHSQQSSLTSPSSSFLASSAPASVTITPSPGTVVQPGETVTMSLTIVGGGPVQDVIFRIGEDLRTVSGAATPSVGYTVPLHRAGRVDVVALATGTDGRSYLATTFFTVAPDEPVQQLAVTPAEVSFWRAGDRAVLRVLGTGSSGNAVDVTSRSAGTTYSTLTGTSSVVTVSPDGVVEARGSGTDAVLVRHGALAREVRITVSITNRPPQLPALTDLTVHVGASATIDLSATDPDGDALTFFVNGLPLSTTLLDHGNGTGRLTFAPGPLDVGTHAIAVTVADSGHPAEEARRVFQVIVPAPAPGSVPPDLIAYVPLRGTKTLARFDMTTGQMLGDINLADFCSFNGTVDPIRVGIDRAGFRAFVVNPICHGIDVVNLKTGQRLLGNQAVTIDTEGWPTSIEFDRQGRYAYVGSQRSRSGSDSPGFIEVINVRRLSVDAKIETFGEPRGMAIHPSGSVLYASLQPNLVKIVDLSARAVTSTITLPNHDPSGIALSPDSSRAFVLTRGSSLPALVVIDTATRAVLTSIALPSAPTGLAVHPRASRVYVQHQAGITVFNASTLQVLETIASPASASNAPLVFTPDGTTLLSRGADRVLNSHGLYDGSVQPVMLPGTPGWPAVAPACTYEISEPVYTIAAGGGTLRIQVAAPAGCAWTVDNDASWLTVLTPAGAGDGVIELQTGANGGISRKARLGVSGESATVVQSGATGPLYGFVAAMREHGWHQRSYGSAVAVIDLDVKEVIAYLPGPSSGAVAIRDRGVMGVSPDGARLYLGPGVMVDTNTLSVVEDPRATGGGKGTAVSPDGRIVASIGRQDFIWVNDAATNRTIWTLPVDRVSSLLSLGFVGDGQTLFVLRGDSTILVVDMVKQALAASFRPAPDFRNFIISADRTKLFGLAGNHTEAPEILVIDVASRSVIRRLPIPVYPGEMIVNPQATFAYLKYSDTVVRVNLATGETASWQHAFTIASDSMALDPSGQRLYLGNVGRDSVSVMDANTGASLNSISMNIGNAPGRIVIARLSRAPTTCHYNIRHDRYVVQEGHSGTVDLVPTISGCGEWRVASEASWIAITGPSSGTGHGSLTFEVEPNLSRMRTGAIDIHGRKFLLRQAGIIEPMVVLSVTPSSGPATGHTWVTVTGSGFSGPYSVAIGDGARAFNVLDSNTLEVLTAPNTANTTVNVTVAEPNRSFTLHSGFTYSSNGSPLCTASVGSASLVPAEGGFIDLAVTAPTGCKWPAASAVPWIQIASGGGTGTATARLTVGANTGQARRSGSVHVAGQVIAITQAGLGEGAAPCTAALATTAAAVSGFGGKITVDVTAVAGCAWAVAPLSPWISVDGNPVRTGSSNVTLSVATNTTSSARVATVEIAGQPFTVTQAASQADLSFGAAGRVTVDFGGLSAAAKAIVLQPDGRIIVVGQSRVSTADTSGDVALVRLHADGSVDQTFGQSGFVLTDFAASSDGANSVALQPDGKIVVGGFAGQGTTQTGALARYLSTGELDGTFGSGGWLRVFGLTTVAAIAVQPDGRIVSTGDAWNGWEGEYDMGVARHTVTGAPDSSFAGGVKIFDAGIVMNGPGGPGGWHDHAASIKVLPDGKLLVGGSGLVYSSQSNQEDFVLVRLNADGSVDQSFGINGVAGSDMDDGLGGFDQVRALAVSPDGSIVSAGGALTMWNGLQFFATVSLVRHGAGGVLDRTFGSGGTVQTILDLEAPFAYSAGATGVQIERDGRIVVVGDTVSRLGRPADFRIARFTAAGQVDGVFAGNGFVTTDFFGGDDYAAAVALQPDGRIVAAGSASVNEASSVFAIARYEGGGACTYSAVVTVPSFPAGQSFGRADIAAPAGCEWFATSNVPWIAINQGSGVGSGYATFTLAPNPGPAARSGSVTVAGEELLVTQAGPQGAPPTMSLDRSELKFAATTTGTAFVQQTGHQTLRLLQGGAGPVRWTATPSQPWVTVTPANGTGSATLKVGVTYTRGLPLNGTSAATISLTFSGASNAAAAVAVTLQTIANGGATAPVGAIDTPLEGSSGVTGSIAVTGWAVDDIEVRQVRIVRNPVAGEGSAQIFIGNGTFVEDARPDIAALTPNAPRSTRAGWGYLLLTNFLPNRGNGTFTLYAYADDADGHTTLLGARTITCANDGATRPFGAIDTPGQGDVISGANYANFGWVLARTPARAHPPFGTVRVLVDGVFLPGAPGSWTSRADLHGFFPADIYPGIGSALGVAALDTTRLTNGIHTIAWVVTGDNGEADGIGSRYFSVANGASSSFSSAAGAPEPVAISFMPSTALALDARPAAAEVNALPLGGDELTGRRGFDATAALEAYPLDADGRATIKMEELDRIELHLGANVRSGYLRVGDALRPLPIGSHLDLRTGRFTWTPGVGFIHNYDLVFQEADEAQSLTRREIRIVISPRSGAR